MRHSQRLGRQHLQSEAKPHKTLPRRRMAALQTSTALSNAREVLDELHTLLGDYSPTWFTPTHFKRTEDALHRLDLLIHSR
jgi:hypothetical protein